MLIDRRTILRSASFVAAAGVMSIALTSFFWVRQVAEMSWIKVGRPGVDPLYDYKNNFLLTELRLTDGLNDVAMMFFGTYFLVIMIALLIAAIFISGTFSFLRSNKEYRAIALVFLVSAFLTTFTSQVVWDTVPLLHRIQFPWRFLSMASLCFAVLMGLSLNSISLEAWRERRPAVLAMIGLILILLTFSIKQDILAATYIDHKSFENEVGKSVEGVGLEHWQPVWTTGSMFARPERLVDAKERGTVVREWNDGRHEFSVSAGPPTSVRTAITYYPHWQVSINSEPVPAFESDGVLAFDMPANPSEVKLSFVEPNYSVVSRWFSLVAWIIFLVLAVIFLRRPVSREELLA
jgi:hypothetical protein